MRVKPHMSTNAKHRKTRTETVWPMVGPVPGLFGLPLLGHRMARQSPAETSTL
jgi:hypothetical protein